MDHSSRMKITEIKSKIIAMLQERHSLEQHLPAGALENNPTSIVKPSKYWSDFCLFFDYMLDLSEDSFTKLRLHTYHLTGDNYQQYYFGDPDAFLAMANLDALTKGLPVRFIVNEPEDGIGFHYAHDRFVSLDILRYQQVLSTFYHHNVLPETQSEDKTRRYVLEIGGGYGGLAHHFLNIYGNTTYIIIDLPETLLFSAAYLALHNPQKKIYVYEKDGFEQFLQPGVWDAYDFVILPNYVLDSLTNLHFDLVINQASFQEMRLSQVTLYLDFVQKNCRGVLYSWNQDHQPRNKELLNLSDLLKQRFSLTEVAPDWYRNQAKSGAQLFKDRIWKAFKYMLRKLRTLITRFGNQSSKLDLKGQALPYREYICRPLVHSDETVR